MSDLLSYYWGLVTNHIYALGLEYGVDPMVLAFFYVGLAPVVWVSAALTLRCYRRKKSMTLPATVTGITFMLPYIYIFWAGNNLPLWVYGVALAWMSIAGYALYKKCTCVPEADPINIADADQMPVQESIRVD